MIDDNMSRDIPSRNTNDGMCLGPEKRTGEEPDINFHAEMKKYEDEKGLSNNKYRSSLNSSSVMSSQNRVDDVVCRICLGTEEEGNPGEDGQPDRLICPCKCAGSMGVIHISCLKEWVNSKRLVYKGRKVQSFFWKSLECELC
jgi:E3 ubiquitin-protein ligase DOA10